MATGRHYSYKMNNIQNQSGESSLNNFWKRVFIIRGLLFKGESYSFLNQYYTDTEIKTAVSLNKKYFLNKCSGGLKV